MEKKQIDKALYDNYKRRVVETFRDFMIFCDSRGIEFFLCYGALIGAVRHRGMIPWDDDIDVFLTRENYNRLLSYREELRSAGHYDIVDINNDGYYLPFAKFVNIQTTLWENKEQPFIIGAFLDLFILDECDGDREKAEKLRLDVWDKTRKYNRCYNTFTWKEIWDLFRAGHPKGALMRINDKFYFSHRREAYRGRVQECLDGFAKEKGDYYCYYTGMYGADREVFPKEWFSGRVYLDFEGMKVPACIGYDSYLRQVYGDYMQLPPIEKRLTTHYFYFVDPDRRLDIRQIEEIKKKEKVDG